MNLKMLTSKYFETLRSVDGLGYADRNFSLLLFPEMFEYPTALNTLFVRHLLTSRNLDISSFIVLFENFEF